MIQPLPAISTNADILPGYQWSRAASRYRSNATGRFTSRRQIVSLLNTQVAATEAHFGEITTAFHEGKISATAWQEQMRAGIRRQMLAQESLGAGGWDRLGPRQFGRAGRDLRDQYGKIAGTAQDIAEGKITLPQALARSKEIAGNARSHFYAAERDTVRRSASNMVIIERRILSSGGNHCTDCVEFYDRGWELLGSLPPPATDSICRGNCQCSMLRREVEASEVNSWLGTKQ